MRWALALLAAAACGTTHIHTDDRSALIYVDGELAGRGDAETRRFGVPHTADILVIAPDGRRARRSVARSFTSATLVAGLFTDLVGLLVAWELPESIYVPLGPAGAGWDSAW